MLYSPFYRYLETPNFVLHGSQGGIVKFLFFNQTTKATTKIVRHTYASYTSRFPLNLQDYTTFQQRFLQYVSKKRPYGIIII